MRILESLAWICCRGGWLVLSMIRRVVLGAMLISAALMAFILAAQLTRYGRTGAWHPVPVAELLEILKIDAMAIQDATRGSLISRLIDAPGTLCLAAVVAVLFVAFRSTRDLERSLHRYDPFGLRRKAMIREIEDELARLRR